MKTGFIRANVNIPGDKYYMYHGIILPCKDQPNPGIFNAYDAYPPYGPIQYLDIVGSPTIGWSFDSSNYVTTHNSTRGNRYQPIVGQDYPGVWYGYFIYRVGLVFDTTVIDPLAKILSAYIQLVPGGGSYPPYFDVIVERGHYGHPLDYWDLGDYFLDYYGGNGGSVNTSSDKWWEIDLNQFGISWIDKFDKTRLCLRSYNDIYSIIPSGREYVAYSLAAGTTKLKIAYQLPI